jgi:hypothetical protein
MLPASLTPASADPIPESGGGGLQETAGAFHRPSMQVAWIGTGPQPVTIVYPQAMMGTVVVHGVPCIGGVGGHMGGGGLHVLMPPCQRPSTHENGWGRTPHASLLGLMWYVHVSPFIEQSLCCRGGDDGQWDGTGTSLHVPPSHRLGITIAPQPEAPDASAAEAAAATVTTNGDRSLLDELRWLMMQCSLRTACKRATVDRRAKLRQSAPARGARSARGFVPCSDVRPNRATPCRPRILRRTSSLAGATKDRRPYVRVARDLTRSQARRAVS